MLKLDRSHVFGLGLGLVSRLFGMMLDASRFVHTCVNVFCVRVLCVISEDGGTA